MGTKLLLADDSITIQKVVGIIFASEDYQLTIVDNGDAALAKAREIRPDVLLVDAVMPGRTGYEVCEEIRRDPGLKGVPILLLTGAFEPFDEEKARRSGADDFISKPFESQHLIDKVTTLLELGKRRAAAPAPGPAAAPSPQVPPPPRVPLSVNEEAVPPPPRPAPAAAPLAQPPLAGAGSEEAAPAAASQFEVEMVEGALDDDLWGAFELEEVAEVEAAGSGGISFEEEQSFAVEAVEEPFSFAEEPETAAQPAGLAPQWGPVGEEAFAFEEEAGGGAFEIMPEQQFDVFEEETPIFEAAPIESTDYFAEIEEPPPSGLAEFFAEPAEPAAAEPAPLEPLPAPVEELDLQFAPGEEYLPVVEAASAAVPPSAAPEFELQFAPEEEYVPVPDAVRVAAPAAAPIPVGGAPSLSEDQLAALVARISRDILEKIAWEVVPDLAERIIREEIRKIKEG